MYQYKGASFIHITGCSPGPQSIIYINADLWLIGPLGTTWVTLYKTYCNIIQENAFENIICEMAVTSLQSQCGQRMMIHLICFCPRRFLVLSIIPTHKMTLAVQTMISRTFDKTKTWRFSQCFCIIMTFVLLMRQNWSRLGLATNRYQH